MEGEDGKRNGQVWEGKDFGKVEKKTGKEDGKEETGKGGLPQASLLGVNMFNSDSYK